MRRPLLLLGACLVLLLGGVAWISVTALRLETAEARARRMAVVEEGARLALWRMDSTVAPFLSREGSQPTVGYLDATGDEDLLLLRFEMTRDGEIRSRADEARRARFQGLASRGALLVALGDAGWRQTFAEVEAQQRPSANEYVKRSKSVVMAQNAMPAEDPRELRREAMRPIWVAGELVIMRRVDDTLQGAWVDWPALRRGLIGDIADLFPGAELVPAGTGDAGERLLASLPVRLVPGAPAGALPAGGAPVRLILGGAWAAVLVAAAAMAVLLFGTLALSERRATFVSAVTHELRTPLTTLRTYTEMLAGGMVKEEKRAAYLATLAREAERLARLVDNVLLYARLERGRGPARLEDVTGRRLVAEIGPRLEERAAAAGLTLRLDVPPELTVRADPVALEQILFNLVDNACKYGRGEIRVRAGSDGVVRVDDDGEGIADEDRRALFEPFARSAERAAGSAPGVGLGLALCRRLARAMGGELTLEDARGARFALRLRRVS